MSTTSQIRLVQIFPFVIYESFLKMLFHRNHRNTIKPKTIVWWNTDSALLERISNVKRKLVLPTYESQR